MNADAVLNAYIDLNLLLAAGVTVWLALRWALSKSALGLEFIQQQNLLNWMIAGLVAAPFAADMLNGRVITHAPNLSDMLVSQYLSGNVGMSATAFEGLLGAREAFERDFLLGQSPLVLTLWALLGAGAVFSLLFTARAASKLRGILKGAYVLRKIGRVQLLVSDTTRVAFATRGLRNRYVVLPSGMLQTGADLRLVVAHELQHFRHRDVEIEFVFEALRPFLFWNPAFFMWRQETRAMREYACDQALVRRHGFDARAYCECLIRACETALKARRGAHLSTPTVGLVDLRNARRGATLKRRIVAATATRRADNTRVGWLMLLAALLTLSFATALLIQRPADWSHDRLMLSTIVNLERMAARNAAPAQADLPAGFVFSAY
ncbi:MAG: M56 family metallopeptidase [Pelagimonas sp.]|uniref:M56 family metallopeptidase n=1 Tax=Pelagimonas sp. TaxID=2073170 RepID=UPI003D6B8A61